MFARVDALVCICVCFFVCVCVCVSMCVCVFVHVCMAIFNTCDDNLEECWETGRMSSCTFPW